MFSLILFSVLIVVNYFSYKLHNKNDARKWADFSMFNIGLCTVQALHELINVLNNFYIE
jgi:hypothetical protein